MIKYATREQWLNALLLELVPLFKQHGYKPPTKYRISCGWPKRSRGKEGSPIGQCFSSTLSTDKSFELFISPELSEPMRVADVVCHEFIHPTVGLPEGHGTAFKQLAVKMGLTGKMTATIAGPEFIETIKPILKRLGKYPHAKLNGLDEQKKQSTRLVKCYCEECGYICRTTATWILTSGAPLCPCNTEVMKVEVK